MERPSTPVRKTRRSKGMGPESIQKMKDTIQNTPRKTRTTREIKPSTELTEPTITIREKGKIPSRKIQLPKSEKEYWENNLTNWKTRLEQIQTYHLLNYYHITQRDIETIFLAAINLFTWDEKLNPEKTFALEQTITEKLEYPTYSITSEVPWLVKQWPRLVQYITLGDM